MSRNWFQVYTHYQIFDGIFHLSRICKTNLSFYRELKCQKTFRYNSHIIVITFVQFLTRSTVLVKSPLQNCALETFVGKKSANIYCICISILQIVFKAQIFENSPILFLWSILGLQKPEILIVSILRLPFLVVLKSSWGKFSKRFSF